MPHGQRGTAAATAGALVALLATAPLPAAALRSLTDAGSVSDPTALLVPVVALLAWAVAGWLALTVAVVLLTRVPGLLGRTARAVAGRVAPAAVRRAVEAAVGITVAVGVVAPPAALAAPTTHLTAVASAETAWDLDWPSRTAAPTGPPPTTTAPTTAPTAAATAAPATTAPQPQPQPPPPPPPVVRPSPVTPATGAVVVQPGDSLWSLAEASLRRAGTSPDDRQVAQTWPRWWAANREAVGDDPDLLLPGTVLRPPGSS